MVKDISFSAVTCAFGLQLTHSHVCDMQASAHAAFGQYARPQQSRNSCCFTEAMHVSESLVLADPDASWTHQASVAELSLPPPRDRLCSIWIGVGTAASF